MRAIGSASSTARALPWYITAGIGLAAAFVVPLVLHAAGLDWVILPLLLLGAASLLRSGDTLLDRLVLGGLVTAGALLSAGLLFSLWPWGLSPLPVGWFTLSALVVAATLSARRPQLPLKVAWSDGVVVGSGLAAFYAAYRPLANLDAIQRLRYTAGSLDRMAHFALFDTIRHTGSYAFLDQEVARRSVQTPTEAVYPQGSHFLLALTETWLRSGSRAGTGAIEVERYFILVLGQYALLVMCIVWSACWIAGRATSQVGRLLVALVAAGFALLGPLAALIPSGANSEICGLIFVALVAALTVRPLPNVREQVIAMAALAIAVVYSYNLYGLFVIVALAVSALAYRAWWWPDRGFVIAVGIPAVAIAALPWVFTVAARFDVRKQVLMSGTGIPIAPLLVLCVAGVAALPFASRVARRTVAWRGFLVQVVAVALTLGAFALYEMHGAAADSYYLRKMVTAAYVGLLPCLGTLGLVLRDGGRAGMAWTRRALGALACTALVAASTLQQRLPGTATSANWHAYVPIVRWSQGASGKPNALAAAYMALAREGRLGDGKPTLAIHGPSAFLNWAVSFTVASLNGDLGRLQPALALLEQPRDESGRLIPGSTPPERVVSAINAAGSPLRVIVWDRAYAAKLQQLLADRPAAHVTIVVEAAPQ